MGMSMPRGPACVCCLHLTGGVCGAVAEDLGVEGSGMSGAAGGAGGGGAKGEGLCQVCVKEGPVMQCSKCHM